MVEVIHRYQCHYPFGLPKQVQNTFVEVYKQNLTEESINIFRAKSKILREINSHHIIKLVKTLKEQCNLHLLYEYHFLSLEAYVNSLNEKDDSKSIKQLQKNLFSQFNHNISAIIEILIKVQILAELSLANLGLEIVQKNKFILKIFIDPQSEFLSVKPLSVDKNYQNKSKKQESKEILTEFYDSQKIKINSQYQELIQKKFGQIYNTAQINQPNFIISGTKLVFINSNEVKKNVEKQQKIEKIEPKARQQSQKQEATIHRNQQIERQKQAKVENNKQLKQKNLKKIQQIKQNINHLAIKNPQMPSHTQHHPTFKEQNIPQINIKKVEEQQKIEKIEKIQKIEDFNQSFEPDFKPEEFTKQNTYILEEHDYLQSLEEEIQRLAIQKKKKQGKKNTFLQVETQKQGSKKQKFSQNEIRMQTQENKNNSKQFSEQEQNKSSNSAKNFQNNSNNDSYQKNGNSRTEPKQEQKVQKLNKYRMKIITSHEIEIEGGGEAQDFQKDILDGIRTGKININDFSNQNASNSSTNSNNANILHSYEKQQASDVSAKNVKVDSNSQINESKNEKKVSQKSQKIEIDQNKASSNKTFEEKQKQIQREEKIQNEKNISKNKTINDIIEKIGIKTNKISHQNDAKIELKQAFNSTNLVSMPGVKLDKVDKLTTNEKVEKVEKIQKQQKNQPIEKNIKMEHIEKVEKVQKIQTKQRQKVQKDQQQSNTDNYYDKIRQAKNKAEQVLKEYAKAKKH